MALPVRRVVRSFGFAGAGLLALLRSTPNFWVHLGLGTLALVLSVVLGLAPGEIAVIVVMIAVVLSIEAFNTALESLADVASPSYHPLIKRAKDISAAAVLIGALCALAVAALLFLPKLLLR